MHLFQGAYAKIKVIHNTLLLYQASPADEIYIGKSRYTLSGSAVLLRSVGPTLGTFIHKLLLGSSR
jgi:hypothetical protein